MRCTTAAASAQLLLSLVRCVSLEVSPRIERARTRRRVVEVLLNHTNLGEGLAFEVVNLTTPTVTRHECGHRNRAACKGGGAYYVWCDRLIQRIEDSDPEGEHLTGLSYGVSNWDSWSKYWGNEHLIPTHLYDCFATESAAASLPQYARPYTRHDVCLGGSARVDGDGRSWETLGMHLKGRPPLSTLVKIDVEGSEWEALPGLLGCAPCLRAVALLDVEFHFCLLGQPRAEKMVDVLRALTESFAVTGRFPNDSRERVATYGQQFDKGGECGGMPSYVAVSYVNRQLLPVAAPLDPIVAAWR